MADLVAQGADPHFRWRRALPDDHGIVLGRLCGGWDVPWDTHISRRHVELYWDGDRLAVAQIEAARNPVFFQGQPRSRFDVQIGEHFVIGGTTFSVVDERVLVTLESPPGASQQAFSPAFLHSLNYRDADQRIEVLSRLPEMIQGAGNDQELFVRLIGLILTGIPRATAAAVVAVAAAPPAAAAADTRLSGKQRSDKRESDQRESDLPQSDDLASPGIEILHWDHRTDTEQGFAPSGRLICSAVTTGKSVVSVWNRLTGGGQYTQQAGLDWAYCTPVLGQACQGWAIYVAGRFDLAWHDQSGCSPEALQDELKFTELAATTLRNLRENRLLEQRQSSLRSFFSPVVLEALAGHDPDHILAPREADVSVLFCDLRGFSRRSERDAGDLLGLLHRVSGALGVMTHFILERGGVVGDFHGDAAMGFWGWPLEDGRSIEQACRAALSIRAEFAQAAQQQDHPLTDFRIGIGLATGPAVAGKIGTIDQVKVTVFGPVVNLAARLETMTKTLRAPLLIDEATAREVRRRIPRDVARVRRLATVRPYGMQAAVEVSELLPPVDQFPQLSDAHITAYEQALDALLERDWETAFELLHEVPADDRAKDFLTVFIAQHNRMPPEHWDGVIPLANK